MSDTTGDLLLNSTVAHIHARRENGPRWDPAMTEDQNRAASNLILLCFEHSREIDDVSDKYPAADLQRWKVDQFDEYQALQRSWSVTDDQAQEALEVSLTAHHLGRASAGADAVLRVARFAVLVVETARRERRPVEQVLAEYEARVAWYTDRSMVWDDRGERLTVQPPRVEVDQFKERLRECLVSAVGTVEPRVMDLLAELSAVKAACPELAPWCDWCARCAAAVTAESGLLTGDGDAALETTLTELTRSSASVTAAWRGENPEPPPNPPESPAPPMESPEEAARRVHREVLERARPWRRVRARPYDAATYDNVVRQLSFASHLPPVVSEMPYGLDAGSALAAAILRNANDDEFVNRVEEASLLTPLAVASYLLVHLRRVAMESGRNAIADDAKRRLEALLSAESWTDAATWEANGVNCRAVLEFAAQVVGEQEVFERLRDAIPAVGAAVVLSGLASWREQFRDLDFNGPSVNHRHMGENLPPWLPHAVLLNAVRREWPDIVPDVDAEGDEVESLAAQFVAIAERVTEARCE